ncbi:helix-turn-helix transcriptional regulator [Lentzea sp.]|uniref:helix-turn-helix domain-containing protein n=1 Tax=Lentzea sp. TaxID=56099 RepID=UPI002ED0EF84
MTSTEGPALQLARRLRSLRKQHWSGIRITQEQLAHAFGVSVPLISSWERSSDPAVPPVHRLDAYATFFATARSIEQTPYGMPGRLDDVEQAAKASLLAELTELRDRVMSESPDEDTSPLTDNLWRFPPDEDITIVCSELPERLLSERPFTDPEDPDYVALYRFSDLDSLLELHGHIRAINPSNNVRVLSGAASLPVDAYTSHLVLLGGIDWNKVTAEVLRRIDLPIRQQERPEDSDTAGFEVVVDGTVKVFKPVLRRIGKRQVLEEDVAHFYRSRNPFNRKRTATICNGVYSRGVLGAVRALTDQRFRDRNNDHLVRRFGGQETISVLSRVQVLQGAVVTPDWTSPEFLLHEWAM